MSWLVQIHISKHLFILLVAKGLLVLVVRWSFSLTIKHLSCVRSVFSHIKTWSNLITRIKSLNLLIAFQTNLSIRVLSLAQEFTHISWIVSWTLTIYWRWWLPWGIQRRYSTCNWILFIGNENGIKIVRSLLTLMVKLSESPTFLVPIERYRSFIWSFPTAILPFPIFRFSKILLLFFVQAVSEHLLILFRLLFILNNFFIW